MQCGAQAPVPVSDTDAHVLAVEVEHSPAVGELEPRALGGDDMLGVVLGRRLLDVDEVVAVPLLDDGAVDHPRMPSVGCGSAWRRGVGINEQSLMTVTLGVLIGQPIGSARSTLNA